MNPRIAACAAIGLASCAPFASATSITVYHDRAIYEVDGGGPCDFEEDFEGFGADASFQTSSVPCNGFTIQQDGPDTFRNFVDANPPEPDEMPNSAHASMFVNGDGPTSVDITPVGVCTGFGADFVLEVPPFNMYEGVSVMVLLQNSAPLVIDLGSFVPDVYTSNFFGVLVAGDTITKITFRSNGALPDPGGEGFAMDNTCMYETPAPSAALPLAALAFIRRRRSA